MATMTCKGALTLAPRWTLSRSDALQQSMHGFAAGIVVLPSLSRSFQLQHFASGQHTLISGCKPTTQWQGVSAIHHYDRCQATEDRCDPEQCSALFILQIDRHNVI